MVNGLVGIVEKELELVKDTGVDIVSRQFVGPRHLVFSWLIVEPEYLVLVEQQQFSNLIFGFC